jgi:type I restriction enzyme S subunit
MVESELGLIPDNWTIDMFGNISNFAKGRKPSDFFDRKVEDSLPVLLIETLKGGGCKFALSVNQVLASDQDVLMVMDGASSGWVSIGFYGIVGSTLGRFRPNNPKQLSPYLMFSILRSRESDIRSKNVGAAIPHANKDYINAMKIILPPENLNLKFHNLASDIFRLVQMLKEKNDNLRKTRNFLLPKLISGEIDVSNFPEPESI